MKITYDSKADTLNIALKKRKIAKTIELVPEIVLDINKAGNPLYIETIGASEKIGKQQVSEITMRNLISTT